jgi:hypothetical protein
MLLNIRSRNFSKLERVCNDIYIIARANLKINHPTLARCCTMHYFGGTKMILAMGRLRDDKAAGGFWEENNILTNVLAFKQKQFIFNNNNQHADKRNVYAPGYGYQSI